MNNNGLLWKTLSILNLLLVATLLLLSSAEAMNYKTTQITDNNYYDGDPQINKQGQIVWIAVHENYNPTYSVYYELFLWDKGKAKCIATNIDTAGNPGHFDLNNNGQIVWFQYNETKSYLQIYLYNNGVITNISNNNYDNFFPRINNMGQIVWDEYDGTNYNLCLYDKEHISLIQKNSPGPHGDFQINDNGSIIWSEPIYGSSNHEIYSYINGVNKNISADFNGVLKLNKIDQVIYLGKDLHTIYRYHNNVIEQIVNDPYQKLDLQVNDFGDIVWSQTVANINGNNIFIYNNGIITQIKRIGENCSPCINNNKQIAWQGTDGLVMQYNIFLNEGGITTQITDDSIQKMFPKINDNGHIVWEGGAGENSEIYLAIPISDISAINMLLLDD
jgi:hypothetical protein